MNKLFHMRTHRFEIYFCVYPNIKIFLGGKNKLKTVSSFERSINISNMMVKEGVAYFLFEENTTAVILCFLLCYLLSIFKYESDYNISKVMKI